MTSTQQQQSNKQFIQAYFHALSGKDKTPELCAKYTTDKELLEHIAFFEAGFPRYELYAEEMTAEANKVVVKCKCIATHSKDWNGMQASNRTAEFPFVVSYTVENNKIIDHWILIDQMSMMSQLQAE